MKYLVIALVALVACEDEAPETAERIAAKAQCTAVLKHIVEITPQRAGGDPDQIVAALPVEDIQACVATEPSIRACLLHGSDLQAVKECIPDDKFILCQVAAADARHRAEHAANKLVTFDSKKFDDMDATCLAEHRARWRVAAD